METIVLYPVAEFRKLFPFENSYNWLELDGKDLTLVEVDSPLPQEVEEAKAAVASFEAGDSAYIHPWDLAVSGKFDLPKKFLIKA